MILIKNTFKKAKADAKKNLQNAYGFTPEQTEAIVTMQLYKLSNTDISIFVKEKETWGYIS